LYFNVEINVFFSLCRYWCIVLFVYRVASATRRKSWEDLPADGADDIDESELTEEERGTFTQYWKAIIVPISHSSQNTTTFG